MSVSTAPDPQVVVVTGASAGVGRAVVRRYAERGARIALLARGHEGLQAAVKDVEAAGGQALAIPVDVADHDAVEAAAARVEEELGPIDLWVNNAFSAVFAPFWDVRPEEFKRVTEVCYLGFVHGTMAALRRMRPRDRGVVVQVGSALAYRGIPLQSAYCGAKHAIQGFNESLRCELLHEKSAVRVTMVQLPAINTPQFSWVLSRLPKAPQPVPPIFQPEVAADAVVYAADHPGRREYWVGWPTVRAILGNYVAPGLLDRYLGRTGFSAQQTAEPNEAYPLENLWEPVDEDSDFGAHGRFDDRASDHSYLLAATQRRGLTGLATLAAGATLAGTGALVRRALGR